MVMIHVRVDEREPPCGEVSGDDTAAVAFSGWLDLLRVLSELLEAPRAGSIAEPPPS